MMHAIAEAQSAVAQMLTREIPQGFDAIVVNVNELAPVQYQTAAAVDSAGESESIPLSWDVDPDVFSRLREVMYRPGSGTWFSAEFRVDRSGRMDSDYVYDLEPDWTTPVDSIAYVTDFEKFPRDLEHQPQWLRDRLSEGYERRAARS